MTKVSFNFRMLFFRYTSSVVKQPFSIFLKKADVGSSDSGVEKSGLLCGIMDI